MGKTRQDRSPLALLTQALDGGLKPGEIGVIAAKPGVGKSALLVHFALGALLLDQKVLLVALRTGVDHVRSYYDELMAGFALTGGLGPQASGRQDAMVSAERHRIIHSYLDKGFDAQHLSANLWMLGDVAQFTPRLVVIDGFNADVLVDAIEGIAALAAEHQVPIWLTVRVPEGTALDEVIWDHARVGFSLTPEGETVGLCRVDGTGSLELPVRLDPVTMLVLGHDTQVSGAPQSALSVGDCTLYSGGANGAEACFGEAAERFGVNEVNFTFDGHKQGRDRGTYELSPRELAAGDVSLVYVSRRLNRTYSEGSLIRKVLQTLWHMVSRSQQVFIVGTIQEDGTVVGGTGWSVELARMWNKTLWVFDQERNGWYHWSGDDWSAGTPTIDTIHFTGAGTRYLADNGREAIHALFARSFGA